MRSQRCIVSLRWNPAVSATGARRAISGFLRYIQYRDHHEDASKAKDVDGLLRYVAHRDRAASQARLFNGRGDAGEPERKQLGLYIGRSVKGLEQQTATRSRHPQRACYRLVISPEDARGLDLRLLTRAAMAQLARDAGEVGLPPWIAAEHRNTAHPHVHVVLAAGREVEPGRFRQLVITRQRLARIKEAVGREIALQRGERYIERQPLMRRMQRVARECQKPKRPDPRWLVRQLHAHGRLTPLRALAARMARRYQLEAEREAERQRLRGRDR